MSKLVSKENLKAFRQRLDDKYVIEGEYSPNTKVGFADLAKGIDSDRTIDDIAVACPPITFGSAGGNAEIQTGFQKFTELHGNSVGWNQLCDAITTSSTQNGIAISCNSTTHKIHAQGTADGDAYINLNATAIQTVVGHKYLLKGCPSGGSNSTYKLYLGGNLANADIGNGSIFEVSTAGSRYIVLYVKSGETIDIDIIPQLHDLTKLDKEYEDVVSFNRDYPLPYYEFNKGSLLSSKSTSLISVGMNQFDGELEPYGIVNNTGLNNTDSDNFRTKNYIRVISGEKYIFCSNRDNLGGYMYIHQYDKDKNFIKTISYIESGAYQLVLENNTCYVRIHWFKSGSGWSTNPPSQDVAQIMVRLYWDIPNLPYEAYKKQVIELPNIELRSAGSVYDIAYYSGGGKRRIGQYTFTGNETWTWYSDSSLSMWYLILSIGQKLNSQNICSNGIKCVFAGTNGGVLRVLTSENPQITSSTNMNEVFANGTVINVELAAETDITTEENQGWIELAYIDNYGTLEYTSEQAIQVPQAYYIEYTVNLVEFLDSAYVKADGDANNLVVKSELEYNELENTNIGSITSTTITTGFYKNEIEITNGLQHAIDVKAKMSNGAIYPMINNNGTSLITFSGLDWQANSITVTKIYYKE